MTTTELIKILQEHECGGISHEPREISLTVNGMFMPSPCITLSSTGDGICGPEISFDVDGDMWMDRLIEKIKGKASQSIEGGSDANGQEAE